jgi:Na+:H+ antiporter
MSSFLQLVLTLVIIITGAKMGGWLANRLRQPAVLGELLAGMLLGPSVLNLLGWSVLANEHDPHLLAETVFELAELGVVCLMFLAGLEIDPREMRRAGRVATLAGVSGVIVPLAVGWLVALLVILLLSIFTAMVGGGADPGTILTILLKMLAYLSVTTLLGFFILPRLAEWVHGQPISEGLAALVLVTALLFAWSAEVVGGLAAITGAFIAGVGFGRSRLRDEIERDMHTITYAFLVPIFFVSIGLKTNARLLIGPDVWFALALVLVAVASKVLGCGLGARWGGFNKAESLRVGVGMISRGEVGLIVATVGVDAGLIKIELFSVVTFIVLITTLVTPLLLRLTFTNKEAAHA